MAGIVRPMRLEPILRVLQHFGNPQDQVKTIHITGTNGKGSVACFLACMLAEAGHRVGRFSSPHLLEPHDALRINETTIDRTEYWTLHDIVSAVAADCSPFERQTATAFLAFQKLGMEFAVVEVGMGGRVDATNVMAQPLATVFTPLGHDHIPILGNTVADIAQEKAGILKAGRPCILAPQAYPEAAEVIRTRARELGCPLFEVAEDATPCDLPLPGAHQRLNFLTARCTLAACGLALAPTAEQQAMQRVWWPGRLQQCVIHGRRVLLDGAHNPEGVSTLKAYIDAEWRGGDCITWMVGMTHTRDPGMLRPCLQPQDMVVTLPFDPPAEMDWIRCASHAALSQGLARPDALAAPDFHWAFAHTKGPVVICGSLYLAAQALRAFPTEMGVR
eukprot:GGOE01043255.1.p1 GENE.GGOE01043255.1~~GGOE01043255.1.p1  ORF type:complete len:401 (+),score=110.46 GGOE01043255.1:36-1205(+)